MGFSVTSLPSSVVVYTSKDGAREITCLSVIAVLASPQLHKAFSADPDREYPIEELKSFCALSVGDKSFRRGVERYTGLLFERNKTQSIITVDGVLKKVFLFRLKKEVVKDLIDELCAGKGSEVHVMLNKKKKDGVKG